MRRYHTLFFCCLVFSLLHSAYAQEMAASSKPLPSAADIAKLPPDGGDEFNRLIFEQSPYLLQHARNPVDWYSWGDEAFLKAEAEDKLIFLSIGYSSCHWCHVMEKESFEDPEVAALLNKDYVCIKVDREERPDLDDCFMKVAMALSQQGGWPNNLFLTPQRKPYLATTYISKNDKNGRPGFIQILPKLAANWTTKRDDINQRGNTIADALNRVSVTVPGEFPNQAVLDKAFENLMDSYDKEYGGFGAGAKFPTPHNLSFLLRYWKRSGRNEALQMVVMTLVRMRMGAIYDQIGLGFHHYTTDKQWLLPHFEKMLSDQALISNIYVETFQATQNTLFSETAIETYKYVLRELTDVEGGFYTAEDADSGDIEGDFYLWTTQEALNVLGTEDGTWFNELFGLREEGNWTSVQDKKKNIVHLQTLISALEDKSSIPGLTYAVKWGEVRKKLFEAREKRVRPHKDDKILCDSNGLMIASLAKGGRVLGGDTLVAAARKAADFILAKMRQPDGRLFHRYRNGVAGIAGQLDDYAFLTWGLLELYESTFDLKYLEAARDLTKIMLEDFQNKEHGGFFMNTEAANDLPLRPVASYDGAVPAGNSVAMMNLLKLGRITADISFEDAATGIAKAFSKYLNDTPQTQCQLLQALDFYFGPSYEVVVAGEKKSEDTKSMLRALNDAFIPNKVTLLRSGDGKELSAFAPFTLGQEMIDEKATAYVCQNYACDLPTSNVEEMLNKLGVKKEEQDEKNTESVEDALKAGKLIPFPGL